MTTSKNYLTRLMSKIGQPMEATNHLHDTAMFRVAIYGPALVAFSIAGVGYLNSNLQPDWTFGGFNLFISTFKLPIGLAGLAIPLGALVASHHRSIQSAKQIESQQRQNTFSNYIKHKEYFGKYLDDENILNGEHSFLAKDKKIYKALFPKAQEGEFEFLSENSVDAIRIEDQINFMNIEAKRIRWNESSSLRGLMNEIAELKGVIADEFELQITDVIQNDEAESLKKQIINLGVTLSHIHSAATFFSDTDDALIFSNWAMSVRSKIHKMNEITDYAYAKTRIKELAVNELSGNCADLSPTEKNYLLSLLRGDRTQKLRQIENDLSELPTVKDIIEQLESPICEKT